MVCFLACFVVDVSTHSHPKVAAAVSCWSCSIDWKFQHTATRRWLQERYRFVEVHRLFQHTATRRWLRLRMLVFLLSLTFQHTATRRWLPRQLFWINELCQSFNTQPPEGGCTSSNIGSDDFCVSTHSHPKVAAG